MAPCKGSFSPWWISFSDVLSAGTMSVFLWFLKWEKEVSVLMNQRKHFSIQICFRVANVIWSSLKTVNMSWRRNLSSFCLWRWVSCVQVGVSTGKLCLCVSLVGSMWAHCNRLPSFPLMSDAAPYTTVAARLRDMCQLWLRSPVLGHLISFIWHKLCQDGELSLVRETVKAIQHSYRKHEGEVKQDPSLHLLSVENLDPSFS